MMGIDFGIRVDRLGLNAPRFFRKALLDNEYYFSFDQYFKDNFSLRGPLLFAKNWLDYQLFRTTDSSEVHIGTHGWLYDDKSIEDYRKEACNDKAYAEHLGPEVTPLKRSLSFRAAGYSLSIAPNKFSIYPEFVGFVSKGRSMRQQYVRPVLGERHIPPYEKFCKA